MNRGQQHLPLDVLPVSALRRRDEFLHPVTGERLRLAAIFPEVIWYSHPGHYVIGKVIDGLVWGLLTAGSFAGFWPD